MSTVAESESAIGPLTPQEVEEPAVWHDEYRQMIRASAEVFSIYDGEIEADLRQTRHDLPTGTARPSFRWLRCFRKPRHPEERR